MVITIGGESFVLTEDSVREALIDAIPGKLHVHWVQIDGHRWPVKQVVAMATGVPTGQFKSRDARNWLRSIGFQIQTDRRLKREPVGGKRARISATDEADVVDMDILECLSVNIDVTWRRAGHITLHPISGRPVFPPLPKQPGLYRFDFGRNDDGDHVYYVGESGHLPRRAGSYRNAVKDGGHNKTSRRIHKKIVKHINEGGAIKFAIATEVRLNDGELLDLRRWSARRMAENAAVLTAQLRPATVVLNIDADTKKVKQIAGSVHD